MEEMNQTQGQPAASPKSRSSLGRVAKVIVIVVIVGAIVWFGYSRFGSAVATVNGERITKAEYDKYYAQASAILAAQGVDISTDQTKTLLKEQSINDLVVETLVLQEADKEDIVANKETVDAQIEQSKKSFADEDAFRAELTKQGFTEKSFRETLTKQSIIQQYLAKHVDVSSAVATEADVQALYKQALAANKDLGSLSSVRTQVEAEVVRQKQQSLVAEYLKKLKESNTIVISQ